MTMQRLENYKEFKKRTGKTDGDIRRTLTVEMSRMKIWYYSTTSRGLYAFNVGTDEAPEFVEVGSGSKERSNFPQKLKFVLCLEK